MVKRMGEMGLYFSGRDWVILKKKVFFYGVRFLGLGIKL